MESQTLTMQNTQVWEIKVHFRKEITLSAPFEF